MSGLDLAIVEEAKSIMGDKFPMMIQFFLEDAAVYIGAIKEGLDLDDAEKIVSPSHTIKSSAHQVGAVGVSDVAREIEELSRTISEGGAGDMKKLKELTASLEDSFAEVELELKKIAEG